MELVYFSGKVPPEQDTVLRAIESFGPPQGLSVFSGIDELKDKVANSRPGQLLAVVRPFDEEALIDVYFARCLLKRVPSILVLPDRERHTAALGFRIGPNYTFPCDTDVGTITSAIVEILGKNQRRSPLSIQEYRNRRVSGDEFTVCGGDRAANF